MVLTSTVNISQTSSRLFVTKCLGTERCYDLMISAHEEATGEVLTSNSLSTNNCPVRAPGL